MLCQEYLYGLVKKIYYFLKYKVKNEFIIKIGKIVLNKFFLVNNKNLVRGQNFIFIFNERKYLKRFFVFLKVKYSSIWTGSIGWVWNVNQLLLRLPFCQVMLCLRNWKETSSSINIQITYLSFSFYLPFGHETRNYILFDSEIHPSLVQFLFWICMSLSTYQFKNSKLHSPLLIYAYFIHYFFPLLLKYTPPFPSMLKKKKTHKHI